MRRRPSFLLRALAALSLLVLASPVVSGCSGSADLSSVPSYGATPGGAQDVGLFREKIARGQVPSSSEITVEGVLAEHDLPIEGEACTQPLCLSSATAIARGEDDDRTGAWIQLGYSSSIDAETFRRPDLDLAVVFDRSGSMAGTKIEAGREALRKLVAKLGPRDRFSLVLFDDRVDTLVEPTFVTEAEQARILGLVSTIEPRGSTDIESGLARGFELVRADATHAERSHRVFLMTDAQPNTGRTGAESFASLVASNASHGIGLTAFGIGLDFEQDLVHQLTQSRGGAYFFLENHTKISTVFDEDFDFMVTPIAYDLKVAVQPRDGWTFTRGYGVSTTTLEGGTFTVTVPTVFLSRRKGATLLRLQPAPGLAGPELRDVAQLSIDYETPAGAAVHRDTEATYGPAAPIGDATVWYEQAGVRKAVALANWAQGIRAGLGLRESGRSSDAKAKLAAVRARFEEHVRALDDAALQRELDVLDRLIAIL